MRYLFKRSWFLAGASSLSVLAAAHPAHAQTTPTAPIKPGATEPVETANSGDIIVTAQKRSERINDVPMSISATTGEQLAKLGITDPSELVRIVPGFTFQQSNYSIPVYGIRGVSFFDTTATANPAVSVYVDQVPVPYSIMTRSASLDVERVEVLKGPQGTLFGQNSTGGAVNYIAAKPTANFAAGLDASYGRFNGVNAGAFASGPLGESLRARIAVRTDQQDDWQYSETRSETAGQRNLTMGRLLLDWDPASSVRVELNINGYIDRSDTQQAQFQGYLAGTTGPSARVTSGLTALQTRPMAGRDARAADWDPGIDLSRNDRFFQSSVRADWEFSETSTLTSITSFIRFKGEQPTDADGVDYNDFRLTTDQRFGVFNQELRVANTFGDLKWLIGTNYQHDKLKEVQHITTQGTNTQIGPFAFIDLGISNDQTVNTYAGFTSLDYQLGNTLTASVAARYTKQTRSYVGCQFGEGSALSISNFYNGLGLLSNTPLIPGSCASFIAGAFPPYTPSGPVVKSINEDNLSWRAGLNWKVASKVLIYGNVTKGFKAGNFSTQPLVFADQVLSTTQESVLAYELGFKSSVLNGRMQIRGAMFYYDYTNKQIQGYITLPIFGNLPALVNVPSSSIKGAELNVDWTPAGGLRLNASGTYVGSRVDDTYIGGTPISDENVDYKGEALPGTPRWQVSADAEYNISLGGGPNAYIGTTVTHRSATFALFGETPGFKLPAYTLLDLRAGVTTADGHWQVQAFGRNVTNKYYLTNIANPIDTVTRYTGMPATYGVKLIWSY